MQLEFEANAGAHQAPEADPAFMHLSVYSWFFNIIPRGPTATGVDTDAALMGANQFTLILLLC